MSETQLKETQHSRPTSLEKDTSDPSRNISSDIEAPKQFSERVGIVNDLEDEARQLGIFRKVTRKLLEWGVETNGITPIQDVRRTDTRIYQLFWLWFSTNFNILAFGTGSAGPAFFGLGLKSSLLVLLVVDIITCAIPAYFSVFGPKLGMRGMVQCRFSWGLYGGAIPSALNVFSLQGFLILNSIIGGQTLAAVSDKINDTLGIVIIGIIALVIFTLVRNICMDPSVISFPILIGLAAKHLDHTTFPEVASPTPAQVLSFASLVASSVISWCTLTPDYGVYHDSKASSQKVFWYTYFGFFAPSIAWHMLGSAFAAAAPGIPSWQAGFNGGNNIGGLLMAVLAPVGGFGKFLIVLIGLSTSSACAPTMYTFGLSAMAVSPFFARVPRYILVIISETILIPLAIIGANKFYATLVDILSVIGYWSTAFAAIVLTEHLLFRKATWSEYNVSNWDQAKLLPPGIAAVLAFACAFGIIVPCMSQTWYTGPVARAGTGDIGVITGGTVAIISYAAFRTMEKRMWGR